MDKIIQLPNYRFHPMCKRQMLTHFIFIYDFMIFCKEIEALKYFSNVTSLVANIDKSNMFVARVDALTKEKFVETKFTIGTFPISCL